MVDRSLSHTKARRVAKAPRPRKALRYLTFRSYKGYGYVTCLANLAKRYRQGHWIQVN